MKKRGKEEENRLIRNIQRKLLSGTDAKDPYAENKDMLDFIAKYTAFLQKVVERNVQNYPWLDESEIMEVASRGLLDAVVRFNVSKNVAFKGFAWMVIDHDIKNYLAKKSKEKLIMFHKPDLSESSTNTAGTPQLCLFLLGQGIESLESGGVDKQFAARILRLYYGIGARKADTLREVGSDIKAVRLYSIWRRKNLEKIPETSLSGRKGWLKRSEEMVDAEIPGILRKSLTGSLEKSDLIDVGFELREIFGGGVSITELLSLGFDICDFSRAGLLEDAMEALVKDGRQNGITIRELMREKVSVEVLNNYLKRLGNGAFKIKMEGLQITDMVRFGFKFQELCDLGFAIEELFSSGYGITSLLDGGLTLAQLKDAGVGLVELVKAKVPTFDLVKTGFKPEEVRKAILSIRR